MSTVDKDFADNIARHGGWANGDNDNTLGDNPRCVLLAALQRAVEMYGKPGGPWNVPGSAGSWTAQARAAIAAATGSAP